MTNRPGCGATLAVPWGSNVSGSIPDRPLTAGSSSTVEQVPLGLPELRPGSIPGSPKSRGGEMAAAPTLKRYSSVSLLVTRYAGVLLSGNQLAGSIPALGNYILCGGRLSGRGGEMATPWQVRLLHSASRPSSPNNVGSSRARDLLHTRRIEAALGRSRGNQRVSGGSIPPSAILCGRSSTAERQV